MPGRHRTEQISDGKRRDPIDITVLLSVHRDPIPTLNLWLPMAMPSVVDQQIVFVGQGLAQVVQGWRISKRVALSSTFVLKPYCLLRTAATSRASWSGVFRLGMCV